MCRILRRDIQRHTPQGGGMLAAVATCLGSPAVWAIVVYRIGRAIELWRCPKVVKAPPWFLYRIAKLGIEITANIHLPAKADIGPGLYIGHFGPVFVSTQAKIGEMCNISQGVTLGVAGRGENRGAPTLGDRVYVGGGAKIIGRIHIGSDVAIGANAVVTKDVPDKAVVVGIPARIISYEGSADFIHDRAV